MYYEILVNGVRLGVYGHPEVRNMHLSVMVTENGPEIFANGVCAEDANASQPQNKYKMQPRGRDRP